MPSVLAWIFSLGRQLIQYGAAISLRLSRKHPKKFPQFSYIKEPSVHDHNVFATTTSLRPYMIEALYKWHVANDFEPVMRINCSHNSPGMRVPPEYLSIPDLVLDAAPDAVDNIQFGPFITMTAYFEDGAFDLRIPCSAVIAIHSAHPQFIELGFFAETGFSPEDFALEQEILRKEEMDYLRKISDHEATTQNAKDNALSRSKLKIVSSKAKQTDASKS